MKPLKVFLLATAVTVAYLPMSAGAFGFGASRHEYGPPPWEYGPYGPPPYARNVQGMYGGGKGPVMSWGSSETEAERQRKLEHYRNPWKYTKDWNYESPYKNAKPWKSPFDRPMGEAPPR
jgi:hypothetical protein